MNLLDSVLINCKADNYRENFRKHKIDAYTLKILNDEDLQLLQIEDEDTRKAILKYAENLQIPAEKKIDLNMDKRYMNIVLNTTFTHLDRYYANFNICYKRTDEDMEFDICGIRVTPGIRHLEYCLSGLEQELENFKDVITGKKRPKDVIRKKPKMDKEHKKSERNPFVLPVILIISPIVLFGAVKLFM